MNKKSISIIVVWVFFINTQVFSLGVMSVFKENNLSESPLRQKQGVGSYSKGFSSVIYESKKRKRNDNNDGNSTAGTNTGKKRKLNIVTLKIYNNKEINVAYVINDDYIISSEKKDEKIIYYINNKYYHYYRTLISYLGYKEKWSNLLGRYIDTTFLLNLGLEFRLLMEVIKNEYNLSDEAEILAKTLLKFEIKDNHLWIVKVEKWGILNEMFEYAFSHPYFMVKDLKKLWNAKNMNETEQNYYETNSKLLQEMVSDIQSFSCGFYYKDGITNEVSIVRETLNKIKRKYNNIMDGLENFA